MDGADAYARLGLDESASASDVAHAFRAAAKRCHPDHGGDRREFEALWEAYEYLRAQARPRRSCARRVNPFAMAEAPVARFDAYDAPRRPVRQLTFAEELERLLAVA